MLLNSKFKTPASTKSTIHVCAPLSKKAPHSRQSGFTILEVLLVTVLLAFLALSTFMEVRSTVNAKEEIDQKTEMLQESRAALALLDRDIRAATFISAEDTLWAPVAPNPQQPNAAPAPPKPLPITMFQGSANSLFFSSRSHQRMSADIPENEQHFVVYQLNDGNLVRGESHRAVNIKDREDSKRYKQFTLLTNVKSLVFSYWDEKSEKWTDRWDTERSETQDTLPPAVKVDIEYLPDVPERRGRALKPVRISTSIRIVETAFKTPTPKTAATPAPGTTTGATGDQTGGATQ